MADGTVQDSLDTTSGAGSGQARPRSRSRQRHREREPQRSKKQARDGYTKVVMVLPLRLATSENLIKQFISSLHTPPPNSLKPSVGVLIGVALPES